MGASNNHGRFLFGFGLTDHFLLRQWERRISDQELKPILRELNLKFVSHGMVLVPLVTKDRFFNTLFIKIKHRVLITCFISNIADYMGKNPHEHYVLCDQRLCLSHLVATHFRKHPGGHAAGIQDPNTGHPKTSKVILSQPGKRGKPWHWYQGFGKK